MSLKDFNQFFKRVVIAWLYSETIDFSVVFSVEGPVISTDCLKHS